MKIFCLTYLMIHLGFPLCSQHHRHPPNFVLIIADDVSAEDLGCYGNDKIRTLHIDRLSKTGIRFDNAYLTTSSCSPSRCSIISGKYPHATGAAELHTPLPDSVIPFPLLLKNNGYYTAHAGKWHMGPAAYRAFDRYTDDNGYDNGDGGEDNWVRFLKERPKDKPFFFWLASLDAHRPWGADASATTHRPADVAVPVYLSDDDSTRADIASYYNEIARLDHYVGKVIDELERQGALANTLILIMADNGRPFPRSKTRLYDSGVRTPFIIHWPARIGDTRGMNADGLVSSVDIAPTFLSLAGVPVPVDYQGISFAPMLDDVTIETRDAIYAEHNWHDYEAYERMVRTRDFLYIYNARPNLTNCGPVDSKTSAAQRELDRIRNIGRLTAAQADIFLSPRPMEELFNVKQDPHQLVNVASLDMYKEELNKLSGLLKIWQQETGDTEPLNLTPDWYDRTTGEPLGIERKRGTMPGRPQSASE